ncbi:O-succinylbenzoic acid-CoA ligase [Ignavibacterium album JCM 16511]|uniref:O-succinylbenzoic acid-CoA ligase n=1 Tax=Ignavibacterium album (strain DSM 19864 / JCM 16511 / NBRC 101810 / Mat9-16) TaxID=945713 RepID=I0AJ69_IGNAJ|nr:o-succinylbenzoate--CoA ligase [Ignavibacterium album]AFH49026.1 O-succinylbenzoic acid-CoA ligase [Ignavibacterium album JCM 16511]
MKDFFYKYSNREDLIAVRTSKMKLSYKELFDSADKLSSKLTFPDSSISNYIPILSSNNAEFILITLALWKKGLVPVPINIRWTEKEVESVIVNNKFDLIFYEDKFSDKIKNLNIGKFSFEELFSLPETNTVFRNNDEALVIFTSGSTGEPKGVVHTFNSLASSTINGNDILKQTESDRWLASLPFYHIGGFQIICRALSSGCEIIIPDDLETESLKKAVEQFNPTHISLVSTQLQRLLDSNVKVDESLKLTLIGGGFSEDELIFNADKLGWKPIRVYGSSETASFITAAAAEEIRNKPGTVGKPVKNTIIKISYDDEILISTSSLFSYYLNNPEETKSKLKNGFYHSGDIGRIEDTYLFIETRRNDLIVSGGENVNPYEVEKALMEIPGIKEVCVFPIEDNEWGQLVACAIVADKKISDEEIKKELKSKLAAFKIPKKFYFVNQLPKTSLGKIEREKIRAMFNTEK